MSDRVLVDIDDGVADVRLNRPDKRNALDIEMFLTIADTARSLGADPSIRAVVLSGEGKGFCSGIDTTIFSGDGGADVNLLDRAEGEAPTHAQAMVYHWTRMPQPVIAAVHGAAFGGGFQLALGADIRFATPDAQLSVMEIKWGLVPDMCGTQLLGRLVGDDIAKELTWTGRVVDGLDAERLGIVTHVSDTPRDDALTLARTIASKNPHAIRGAKRLVNAANDVGLDEGLALEAQIQSDIIMSPNQLEAIMSEVQGRPAAFTDPE